MVPHHHQCLSLSTTAAVAAEGFNNDIMVAAAMVHTHTWWYDVWSSSTYVVVHRLTRKRKKERIAFHRSFPVFVRSFVGFLSCEVTIVGLRFFLLTIPLHWLALIILTNRMGHPSLFFLFFLPLETCVRMHEGKKERARGV